MSSIGTGQSYAEPQGSNHSHKTDSGSVTVKTMDGSHYSLAQAVTLTVDWFGKVRDPLSGEVQPVKRFTWKNENGMSVQVISYGAIITSIKVPGKDGSIDDVVLGFDDIPGYQGANNPYFGATVGRVANRIGGGRFTIDGAVYEVTKNYEGRHQLHGGKIGFDKFNWTSHVDGTVVTLSHTNMDGHEGYPGTVLTSITYELKNDNRFVFKFQAVSSKPTPINLTNHSYFNLAGHVRFLGFAINICFEQSPYLLEYRPRRSIPSHCFNERRPDNGNGRGLYSDWQIPLCRWDAI